MIIDCDTCLARDLACEDCVVNLIFHQGLLDLSEEEAQALDNLARVGLLPELRLVTPKPPPARFESWKDSAAG
jgi:hypothetical protein